MLELLFGVVVFFFFNDTATTEIYTLSLHDALPFWIPASSLTCRAISLSSSQVSGGPEIPDRKSTRLNSSHANISYAVFCLKKKKQHNIAILFDKNKKKN